MSEKKTRNLGPLYVLITGVLFSIGGLCMKVVPWNAFSINSFRCLVSAVVIYLCMRVLKHPMKFNRHVFLASLAMCATTCLYSNSVKLTTAGAAIVIQFTVPIWTMLFGLLLYHRKPRRMDILACIVVFVGIAVCFYEGLAAGHTPGNILALLSGITYSGVFMSNSAEDSDPFSSAVIGQFLAGLIGLPWLLRADFASLGTASWVALLVLGIFQMGFGYVFLAKGLETTSPITACLLTGVEPVLNPIWVALFYGEPITPLFALGGAIVLVSVTAYEIWNSRHPSDAAAG